MHQTRLIIGLFLLCALAACASDPDGQGGINSPSPEDAIQTATGAARSQSTDKELEVQTAASQEGDVTQSSADVRNQEDTQSTTSGHIQTLGFAGIGNAAEAIAKDPVMVSIIAELNILMKVEPLDTARIDKLRAQMIEHTERLTAAMAATAPSFDGLKTIIAIFSMENATGHEREPLTDAAAASKADAFKAALNAIKTATEPKKEDQ